MGFQARILECVAMPFSNMHMIIYAKNKLFSRDMQTRLKFLLSVCASVWIFFYHIPLFSKRKSSNIFFFQNRKQTLKAEDLL